MGKARSVRVAAVYPNRTMYEGSVKDPIIFVDGEQVYPAPVDSTAKYVYDGDAITANPKNKE